MTSPTIPRILLVGTGRFGINHLKALKALHSDGKIHFIGAVVRDKKKAKMIERDFEIETFSKLTPTLLKSVDAIDIATPPETHFNLVKESLKYTNVFVEKPFASTKAEALELDKLAREKGRILMVGHIFRFHPVTEHLVKVVSKKGFPSSIHGALINTLLEDQGREPSFELLHLFDIVDFIWKKHPKIIWERTEKRISNVTVRYDGNHDGHFTLGWKGDSKQRTLVFTYPDLRIEADYIANTVIVYSKKNKKVVACPVKEDLIRKELNTFLVCLRRGEKAKVDGVVGARIVSIAERAARKETYVPKVAVIGGGIFGTSIAAELGTFCKVSLFEKNMEILQEGSHINQFRHHFGYHYPRSSETVIDIQNSRKDFEKVFKKAIIPGIPTYYGLAKKGSLVTSQEFIDFCTKHSLPIKKKFPLEKVMAREEMEMCVQVPEPSYFHPKLKELTFSRLRKLKNIKLHFHSIVTGCTLQEDGSKVVTFIENDTTLLEERFDFVVNATYAHINRLADWLEVPHCPIRVDLAEVLIVKLPIKPISLTVIDGPFATLMPTGNPNEFTLYHVKESIIQRYVPKNGLVRKLRQIKSRREAILRESRKLFPILAEAEIVESRIVHRGVQAYREHDDARVADLIEHGFGCWSVLSGKILSSVTTGKRIAGIIKATLRRTK